MNDLHDLQILAQLIDNMDLAVKKIEKSYDINNAEMFNHSKKEILDIQSKISKLIKI